MQSSDIQQLSGLDASFLNLETDNAPMHIGGVSILTGGGLDLDLLRRWVASRIHVSRSFRRCLAEVPLGLGKPYWVDDADFDITRHIERTQLPEPGGWKELTALAAWEFAEPLPRDRPLWHFLLVEGVDGIDGIPAGSQALISRVHHAAIDGVSGAEIVGALFDVSPEVRELPELPPSSAETGVRPGRLDLLRRAGANLGKTPGVVTEVVKEAAAALVRGGKAWREGISPPPMLLSAPRTPFNKTIGKKRVWSSALLSLERIKAIKTDADATVNDVVLAICSGALRRELEAREALPEESLVAMVPISVRAKDEPGAASGAVPGRALPGRAVPGNQVSAMLVALATDEADPAGRLRRIRDEARRSKLYHQAIGARTLTDSAELLPFGISGVATRLYTRWHLAERHDPLFNLVITNVPGPRMPLYVAGARLVAHMGMAPIFDGIGLILPIFSYADKLAISVFSCPEILPDVERFRDFLNASLDELEAAVSQSRDS